MNWVCYTESVVYQAEASDDSGNIECTAGSFKNTLVYIFYHRKEQVQQENAEPFWKSKEENVKSSCLKWAILRRAKSGVAVVGYVRRRIWR